MYSYNFLFFSINITIYFWALRDYLAQLPCFANVKMDPERKVLFVVTQVITVRCGTQASLQCSARLWNPIIYICIVNSLNCYQLQ